MGNEDEDFKREERRGIILLGLLAIMVAYRVTLQSNSVFTIVGVSLPSATILDTLIWLWIGYAACALIYFSDDVFPGQRGTYIRQFARFLGARLLFLYPALLLTLTTYTVVFVLYLRIAITLPISIGEILIGFGLVALGFIVIMFLRYIIEHPSHDSDRETWADDN